MFRAIRAATALLIVLAASCGPRPTTTAVYDPETRQLIRLDEDADGDGRVDARTFIRDGKAIRVEGDTDGDGLTDRWEYYAADGSVDRVGGSTRGDGVEDTWVRERDGSLVVEIATERDGVIDRREFYRGGQLERTETDSNRDGLPDTWEEYVGGRLVHLLLDDTKDLGRPTRRLVYGDGSPRVEIDRDGDGRFEGAAAEGGGNAR